MIGLVARLLGRILPTDYTAMVKVNGGEYHMGCDECPPRERPRHLVSVSDFWMDQYEVTNSQFCRFLNRGLTKGWAEPAVPVADGQFKEVRIHGKRAAYLSPSVGFAQIALVNNKFTPLDGTAEVPVAATWYGAQAYCESVYKRLPTEAEWEYAAKGGHLNRVAQGATDYFRYSGSDDADAVAWHGGPYAPGPYPRGGKAPNELEIYDMSGNCREWVEDWFDPDYYSVSPSKDPAGPDGECTISPPGVVSHPSGKVLRGGSFREYPYSWGDPDGVEQPIDKEFVRVTKRDYG